MKRTLLGLALGLALLAGAALPVSAQKGCADTNKDGVVNSVDAARILQFVAGVYDPGKILLHMWDADGDSDIESTDATIVLQFDAGLLDELPPCLS
jgi:hypothetical protein